MNHEHHNHHTPDSDEQSTNHGSHAEHSGGDHGNHDDHAGHNPDMFRRKFWLSFVLTIPALLFSSTIQHWFGYELGFTGSEYIPAVLGIIIFMYGGLVFLKGAKTEIASRQPGMMTLISIAITVAFGYSLAITLGVMQGMDFWWELASLVTIMLLGHWLEMSSIQNAQGALGELAKLLPDTAERVHHDGVTTVAVSSLVVGDSVLVRPGVQIPADGIVIKGESDVDESLLTGESRAIKKLQSAKVIAGTINGSGALTVRVTQIGESTALAGIMRLVDQAQRSKSRTQVLADQAAAWLTYVALFAALATWIGWALAGASGSFILERVVTVLIIACPHALGLAIPLVTAISTAIAARSGLLIRERKALESARLVDVVVFDKTGTLTTGKQGVVAVVAGSSKMSDDEIIGLAAAVETGSEHPIARAIIAAATDKKLIIPEAHDFMSMAGRGVVATIDGQQVYVGGPRLLDELQVRTSKMITQAATEAATNGQTVIYIIVGGKMIAAIMLADVIRPESAEAVRSLQRMGVRVALLTGDNEGVAAWVSAQLGITEYFAQVLPEDKATAIQELQASGGRVAMVGDGVNDAPALARADVGIAIGAGTDVAIESAGVILASSDPRGVGRIITLSRATYRKMIQNLIWAVGYNVLAIPLAAGALSFTGFTLSPAVGAVLMSVSTIVVAVNAQLLRNVKLS